MANIDKITPISWQGYIIPPEVDFETSRRRGLKGIGVGFDTEFADPVTITTREIVPTDKQDTQILAYRALVQKTVDVVDPLARKFKNTLICKVRIIQVDQLIAPANSVLLTAQWTLLIDVT